MAKPLLHTIKVVVTDMPGLFDFPDLNTLMRNPITSPEELQPYIERIGLLSMTGPSITSFKSLEKMLRSQNRGDARIASTIKKLQELEKNGLISARERQQALTKMTESYKQLQNSPVKYQTSIPKQTIK